MHEVVWTRPKPILLRRNPISHSRKRPTNSLFSTKTPTRVSPRPGRFQNGRENSPVPPQTNRKPPLRPQNGASRRPKGASQPPPPILQNPKLPRPQEPT